MDYKNFYVPENELVKIDVSLKFDSNLCSY